MKKCIFVLMALVANSALAEESVEVLQMKIDILKEQSADALPCQIIEETIGLNSKIEQVIEKATLLQQDMLKQMQVELDSLFQEQRSGCAAFTEGD